MHFSHLLGNPLRQLLGTHFRSSERLFIIIYTMKTGKTHLKALTPNFQTTSGEHLHQMDSKIIVAENLEVLHLLLAIQENIRTYTIRTIK